MRRLMEVERNKRIEVERKKLYRKEDYVPLDSLKRKKRKRQIKCDIAREKSNERQKELNKKYGLENFKYKDPTKRKKK